MMARKDKYLTGFSILFVIVVLLLQIFLVYKLFVSNNNLLNRELNIVLTHVYYQDLGKRLAQRRIQTSQPKKPLQYLGSGSEVKADTTKMNVKEVDGRMASQKLKDDYITFFGVGMEQYIQEYFPLYISDVHNLTDSTFRASSLNMEFAVEIVNTESKQVLETSNPDFEYGKYVLISKTIPLDFLEKNAIRLVANPSNALFSEMLGMLILSLLLSLFSVYCLFYQLKTLSKQRKLAKLKNDFFAEISHEFKQPLGVLYQAISALRNPKIKFTPEKSERYLSIVESEINKLSAKTEMVLSLAMQEEGVLKLNYSEFDLVKVTYDLVDAYLTSPPKHLDIDVDNEVADLIVYADKIHVIQVISNLLSNSIKYSGDSVHIHIRLYSDDENVFISVKDNGLGVDEKDQAMIFEKYARVGTESLVKGHGIGLNYVKRIIEKHKGNIRLISTLGQGSEFIIRLPQSKREKY